jgi:hypothetical protein
MLKSLSFAVVLASTSIALTDETMASEWGCEVLLCVSGDWKGTPTCHPPMYKLIAAMKIPGFSWPICPQANSSKAQYDPFEDCPAGWMPSARPTTSDRKQDDDQCRINVKDFNQPVTYLNRDRDDPNQYVSITLNGKQTKILLDTHQINDRRSESYLVADRPRKEKPYYIEYDDANGVRQRSWFSLN